MTHCRGVGSCGVWQLPLQPSSAMNLHQERWSSSLVAESSANVSNYRESWRKNYRQAGRQRESSASRCTETCRCGCLSSNFAMTAQFTCSAACRKEISSNGVSSNSIDSLSSGISPSTTSNSSCRFNSSVSSSSSPTASNRFSSSVSASFSPIQYFQADLNGLRHLGGVLHGGLWGRRMPGQRRRRGSGLSVDHGARAGGCVCNFNSESSVGSVGWLSLATPYEVLGISEGSSEEDVKAAFRLRIKEYHPDVYQGPFDADAITQRLLKAYELLTASTERVVIKRKSMDPFEEPEGFATNLFVNELDCIGRGCPYSCVARAPNVFQFAPDTGRARVFDQDLASRQIDDYDVQAAVDQCPRNCIHTLTAEQRLQLEEILQSVLGGVMYSSEVVIMDGLLARAKFENGRYQPPKRQPKKSEKWVDWF